MEVGNDFDETLGELEKVGAVLRLNPKELAELQAGRSVSGNLLAFTAKHRATFVRVDSPEVLQTRLLAQLSQLPSESAVSSRPSNVSADRAQVSQIPTESAAVPEEPREPDKHVSEAAARGIIATLGISPELLAEGKALAAAPPDMESDHERRMAANSESLPYILRGASDFKAKAGIVTLSDVLWQAGGRSWEEAIFTPNGLVALEVLWEVWKNQQSNEAAAQMRRVAAVLARVLNGQPADGGGEQARRAQDEVRRRAQEQARRAQEEARRAQEEARRTQEETRLAERRAELTTALEYLSKVIDLWGSTGAYSQRGRGFTSEGALWDNNGAPVERVREPIPEAVRHEVWRRDQGRCVMCGSQENLEFDHIIPHSKGGADTARNIQLLCERCNRIKSDSI